MMKRRFTGVNDMAAGLLITKQCGLPFLPFVMCGGHLETIGICRVVRRANIHALQVSHVLSGVWLAWVANIATAPIVPIGLLSSYRGELDMVLIEDREQFTALIRSANRYVAIARHARANVNMHGARQAAQRALNQAAILRAMAYRFAKPICMMCWKSAERMEAWRSCETQGWCNKCWGWYKD